MRRRTGRFIHVDQIRDVPGVYVVDLPDPSSWNRCAEQDARTAYIRAECRRANWSKIPLMSRAKLEVRYYFLDKEDAMIFKLRFQG